MSNYFLEIVRAKRPQAKGVLPFIFIFCLVLFFWVWHVFFFGDRTRIDFDIAIPQAQGIAKGEFFFDTGGGFNAFEAVSFTYQQHLGKHFRHYYFNLPTPKTVKAIRFDPLVGPGQVIIRNVTVTRGKRGPIHPDFQKSPPVALHAIASIAATKDSLIVTMDGEDPYFLLIDKLDAMLPGTSLLPDDAGMLGWILFFAVPICLAGLATFGIACLPESFFETLTYRPHRLFFIPAILFGFILIVVNPPFQAPDEACHYYRAYQLSEGHIKAEKQGPERVGGLLPASITMLPPRFERALALSGNVVTRPMMKKIFAYKVKPEKRLFMAFSNTAIYTPVSYLPRFLGC